MSKLHPTTRALLEALHFTCSYDPVEWTATNIKRVERATRAWTEAGEPDLFGVRLTKRDTPDADAEERAFWDAVFCGVHKDQMRVSGSAESAMDAVRYADAALAERRKRWPR